MSKVVIKDTEQPLMPQNGKWVWKDGDSEGLGTLEYVSASSNLDPRDPRSKKQGKGMGHQRKMQDNRAQSGLTNRQYGVNKGHAAKSPVMRQQMKRSAEHPNVLLEDVKQVAWGMICDVEQISPHFENGIYRREQFDDFLISLLIYFHWFFEKRSLDLKPNPMNIEPSAAEKKIYAETCVKLAMAQKQLGQGYCVLVLGLGLEDQHHMACGMSRVSATYQDRSMYESLYSYCSYLVWITFRRREFEIIKKEIGRILRSDTFNPAIRVKNAPPENEEGEREPEKKLTPAEYRRLHPKRPAIRSIINQRSPAVVAILPSPKEEAGYLFKRTRPVSPNSLAKQGMEDHDEVTGDLQSVNISKHNLRIGIIGEPLTLFNSLLAPKGSDENEDPEQGEETANAENTEPAKAAPSAVPPAQERAQTRVNTAMSQATTEAFSDNENEQ